MTDLPIINKEVDLVYPHRGTLPTIPGIDYHRHSAIIKKLQQDPETYNKNTGWTTKGRDLYYELYNNGYTGRNEAPAGFIAGDGI